MKNDKYNFYLLVRTCEASTPYARWNLSYGRGNKDRSNWTWMIKYMFVFKFVIYHVSPVWPIIVLNFITLVMFDIWSWNLTYSYNHGKNVLGHLSQFFLFIVPLAREIWTLIFILFCTWRSSLYKNYIPPLSPPNNVEGCSIRPDNMISINIVQGGKGDDFNWWL